MASNTKKLKIRRQLRTAKLGKKRKADARSNGTVQPNLPLNKPTANEQAQKKNAQ